MNEHDLETFDMVQLIKTADLLEWDEDRLLRACHNLLCLDESLDTVFEKSPKRTLKVVRD